MSMFVFPTVDPTTVLILTVFIVIDCISGFIVAVKEHNVESGKMWIGFFKKLAYYLVVALCIALEWACLYLPLPFDVNLLVPACIFMVLIEVTSILENVSRINPDLKSDKFFAIFGNKESENNAPDSRD